MPFRLTGSSNLKNSGSRAQAGHMEKQVIDNRRRKETNRSLGLQRQHDLADTGMTRVIAAEIHLENLVLGQAPENHDSTGEDSAVVSGCSTSLFFNTTFTQETSESITSMACQYVQIETVHFICKCYRADSSCLLNLVWPSNPEIRCFLFDRPNPYRTTRC
jgi:hypothetical protein